MPAFTIEGRNSDDKQAADKITVPEQLLQMEKSLPTVMA